MSFIQNWFDRQIESAWDRARNQPKQIHSIAGARTADVISKDRMDSSPDINFKMYRAENGFIMEVRHYDKRTDRQSNNLHLIPESDDLGQSIAHIITIESLKV